MITLACLRVDESESPSEEEVIPAMPKATPAVRMSLKSLRVPAVRSMMFPLCVSGMSRRSPLEDQISEPC